MNGTVQSENTIIGGIGAVFAKDGKSAYEVAVKNGFVGTEEEWLASLKGDPGTDGYTPVKGVDYFDGKDGSNGKDGADGYTPVKGVDYFDGKDGTDGTDGTDGKDGVSATHSWNGTVLSVTSASGTSSADLKGDKGDKGEDYVLTDEDKAEIAATVDLTNYVTKEDYATEDTAGIVFTNSATGIDSQYGVLRTVFANESVVAKKESTYLPIVPRTIDQAVYIGVTTNTKTLTDAEKATACAWLGALAEASLDTAVTDALTQAKESGEFDGAAGADGYTPVKGVDYFTDEDKNEMVALVTAALPNAEEVSV